MTKIEKEIKNKTDRDLFMITRSTNDTTKELSDIADHVVIIRNVDGMLHSNRKTTHFFIERGRHTESDVSFLPEFHFDLPICTIGNNNNVDILLKRTFKYLENSHRRVAGSDMSTEVFKKLFREA